MALVIQTLWLAIFLGIAILLPWTRDFEGFIAKLESRLPHNMKSKVCVWESPIAINPYFK